MKELASIRIFITYIALLAASAALCTWVILEGRYSFLIILIPVVIGMVIKLIHLYLDSMRKVSFMFNAIDCDDYSFRFSENSSRVNSRMFNASLNRIKEIMTNAKERTIEREKYYERIINSVQTGIVIIDDHDNVHQTNREATELFGLSVFTHLNQLRKREPALSDALHSIKSGENTRVSFHNERGEVHLALSASEIEHDNKRLRIISVSDINSALDQKEVEAWIKLTRVLTHEIMNSLAPITSLSDTLIAINHDKTGDIAKGLETISATGKSLISFVESYRKFTRIQLPVCAPFAIKPLLERASGLICTDDVRLTINLSDDDILIYADEDLITQVIINILKNAVQELNNATDKHIDIAVHVSKNESVIIDISNNGGAIPDDIVEDIFMPFFTNKEDGTGIGLSITKQIMHLHGGSIRLTSNTDDKVTFTLAI